MATYHSGDFYELMGNGQSMTVDNTASAMVFISGNNDTFCDYFNTATTLIMHGSHETVVQYGGAAPTQIFGFNATDSLSVYGLFTNPAAGGTLSAASLTSDGRGGWDATLQYSGGIIDFMNTSKTAIMGAHITAGERGPP